MVILSLAQACIVYSQCEPFDMESICQNQITLDTIKSMNITQPQLTHEIDLHSKLHQSSDTALIQQGSQNITLQAHTKLYHHHKSSFRRILTVCTLGLISGAINL